MGKARTISDIPNQTINMLTEKTTLVDADNLTLADSEDSNIGKRITWANIKAMIKGYTDTLYMALTGAQTIAGVKTFSSSPIIPTPTNATDTANKSYVDGAKDLVANGYKKTATYRGIC